MSSNFDVYCALNVHLIKVVHYLFEICYGCERNPPTSLVRRRYNFVFALPIFVCSITIYCTPSQSPKFESIFFKVLLLYHNPP